MTLYETNMSCSLGRLRLVADDHGLRGVYYEDHKNRPEFSATTDDDHPILALARMQLSEYLSGNRREFDLPLSLQGTPFMQRVWKELAEIPFGETRTYGQIAESIGSPKASRAVGRANGLNPVSIVLPCHRVIGSSGKLTGYAGGIAYKEWLLEHEITVR